MADIKSLSIDQTPPPKEGDKDFLTEIAPPPQEVAPSPAPTPSVRWNEISSSNQFLKLPAEQRAAVRDAYFTKVIAPAFPSDTHQRVWNKFYTASQPVVEEDVPAATSTFGKQFVRGAAGVVGNVAQGLSAAIAGAERSRNQYDMEQAQRTIAALPAPGYDYDPSALAAAGVDRFNEVSTALNTARLGTPPEMVKPREQVEMEARDRLASAKRTIDDYIPVEARPIYKAGLGLRKAAEDAFPVSKSEEAKNPISSIGGQGLGSVAGILATAPLAGPAGPLATGVFAGAGAGYEDAKRAKTPASEEQALDSAFWNGLIGTSEAVPINRFVSRVSAPLQKLLFNKGTEQVVKESFRKAVARYGGKVTQQAVEEATQEAFQTISGNLVANNVVGYDKDRDTFEGVGEATAAGGGVGGVMGLVEAAIGSLAGRRARSVIKPQPSPDLTQAQAPDIQMSPMNQPAVQQAPKISNIRTVDLTRAESAPTSGGIDEVINGDRPVSEIVKQEELIAQGYQQSPTSDNVFFNEDGDIESLDSTPISTAKVSITENTDPLAAAITQQIARTETSTSPTDQQKESGNYKKGAISLHGLHIAIETPAGAERTGKDEDGNPWSATMPVDYGYVKRTEGADGDAVDVFVGSNPTSNKVFVVDQIDAATGKFDEHKAMMGFASEQEALDAYQSSFSDGRGYDRIGAVKSMGTADFKKWLKQNSTKSPISESTRVRESLRPLKDIENMSIRQMNDYLDKAYAAADRHPDNQFLQSYVGKISSEIQYRTAVIKQRRSEKQSRRMIASPNGRPLSAREYISRMGGVRDNRGDLKSMGMDRWHRQRGVGWKPLLNNESGSTLDDMALRMWENGYFPSHTDRPSINDLMTAIETDSFPNGYTEPSKAEKDQSVMDDQNRIWIETTANELGIDDAGKSLEELHAEILFYMDNISRSESVSDEDIATVAGELSGFIDEFVYGEVGSDIPEWVKIQIPESAYAEELQSDQTEPEGRQAQSRPVVQQAERTPAPDENAETPDGYQVPRDSGPTAITESEPATEDTAAGKQTVIKGAERISDKDLAERKMAGRLKPTRQQKDVGSDGGLFDTGARDQADMFTAKSQENNQQPQSDTAASYISDNLRIDNPGGEGLSRIPERGTAAIRREMFDGDIKMKITQMNLEELNQMAFHAGITLTPSRRADRAQLYSLLDDMPISELRSAASDVIQSLGPRPGKVGDMLATGEVVLTVSGRATTPFPTVKTGVRSTPKMVKNVDYWLMDNAIDEAEARGDEYNARIFRANRDKPQQADKDSAELYLFDSQPDVVPSVLKPLVESKPEKSSPISMVRMGDFFEIMGEDAYRAAKVLDMAVAKDKAGTPMLGIPAHSLEDRIADLEAVGITVSNKSELLESSQKPVDSKRQKRTTNTTKDGEVDGYSLRSHQGNIERLYNGGMSAAEVKSLVQQLIDNKASITAELNRMTMAQLTREYRVRKYGTQKKSSVVASAWKNLISDYHVGDSFSWSPFEQTYEAALLEQIDKQTDETIADAIANMKRRTEERVEENARRDKAISDPKTLEDYRLFVRAKGLSSLTPDQLAEYDALSTADKLKQRDEAKSRQAVVSGVSSTPEGITTSLVETKHTQKGHDLFVVQISDRVERDVYTSMNATAKRLGGYYSSFRSRGAVSGFQFTSKESAQKFQAAVAGETVIAENKEMPASGSGRLRTVGQGMIEAGKESMDQDRKVNTARRANMAAGAEARAAADIAMGETLIAIADLQESGSAGVLGTITARTEVQTLHGIMRQAMLKTDRDNNLTYTDRQKSEGRKFNNEDARNIEYPLPSFWHDHVESIIGKLENKPGFKMLASHIRSRALEAKKAGETLVTVSDPKYIEKIKEAVDNFGQEVVGWSAESAVADYMRLQRLGIDNKPMLRNAVREYAKLISSAPKANPIKEAERAIAGAKFDGYFPTPAAVADRMALELDISEDHKILEPSAGKGNLIEAAIGQGAKVENIDVYEVVGPLRDILKLKGYNLVGRDFTEAEVSPIYDRIIMNPPFENSQDIEHVRRAYDLLKPGGKIAAIMGEGAFFRSDKKASEFRDWLDSVDGYSEKLPDGTFKESGTGVNTRLVFITKQSSPLTMRMPGANTPRTADRIKYENDVAVVLKPAFTEKEAAISRKIKTIAREKFGDGLNFRFVDRIYDTKYGTNIPGMYQEKYLKGTKNLVGFVTIALNPNNNPDMLGTLNHEGIHFLRGMGALDSVWGDLRRMAQSSWIKKYDIRTLYKRGKNQTAEQYEAMVIEEAIAHAYHDFHRGMLSNQPTRIEVAFRKIRNFFTGIAEYLRGNGITTWRDVFEDIDAGKYATDRSSPVHPIGSQSRRSQGANNPVFYSAIYNAVDGVKMNSARASEWASFIKKQAGVKQEEIDWIGLEDWLSKQSGQVSKQQVQDFISENQVILTEFVLDDRVVKGEMEEISAQIKASYDIDIDSDTSASELRKRGVAEPMIDRWYNAFIRPDNLTKYSKYTLDGGSNYREMLITLPQKKVKVTPLTELPKGYNVIIDRSLPEAYRYGITDPRESSARPYQNFRAASAEEAKSGALALLNMARQSEAESVARDNVYESQHWDKPNVLAHIRMADHSDAVGNNVLLIEEIQSDWHQKGRKSGYRKSNAPEGLKVTGGSAEEGYYEIRDRNGLFVTNVQNYQVESLTEESALAEAQRRIDDGETQRLGYSQYSVPDAPFKKSWHELAFKKSLRMAVEEGYDAIAWAPGRIHAERYDLSKEISSITFSSWAPSGIGEPEMAGDQVEGGLVTYDKLGKKVFDEFMPVSKVVDYIGKDAANRLFKTTPIVTHIDGAVKHEFRLEGEDLKVGGEGMNGFYDRILPMFVSKYIKKWGGKVESRAITQKDAWLSGEDVMNRIGVPSSDQDSYWRSLSQEDRTNLQNKHREDGETVHWVTITPDMRRSVMSGQAMFSIQRRSKTRQRATEAAQRLRNGSNAVAQWAKRGYRRELTKEGLLGKDVFEIKIESDALKNGDEFDISAMASDLESDVAAVYGKPYSKLTTEERASLKDYLAGSGVVPGAGDLETAASSSRVPEGIKPRLEHMRQYLDRASSRMQDGLEDMVMIRMESLGVKARAEADLYFSSNGATGSLPSDIARLVATIQTIENNKGVYLNRSYQAFDDPKWKAKVLANEALMKKAKAYFKSIDEEMTDAEATGAVRAVLEQAYKKGSFVSFISSGSKVGTKDVSFLKRRKDVPPVIRELLGEYDDPKINFIRSATKMNNWLANHYFLMGVRNRGLDVFLFKEPVGEFDSQIAGDGNDRLSPLDGLYTTSDFVQGMEDVMGNPVSGYPDWLKFYLAINSMVKYNKTVLSPTTQARNFEAGALIAMANGHFIQLPLVMKAWKAAKSDLFTKDTEWRSYLSELIRLGVLHDNPYSSELREAIRDVVDNGLIPEGSKVRRGLDTATKLYRFGDDFWKIMGYEIERQRFLERGLSEREASRKAAKRIRDGYPTYSMTPKAIRDLRRFPAVGTFVSWSWEVMRTSKNNLLFMVEDVRDGYTKHAVYRAIGLAGAAIIPDVLREITMMAAGLDDDDDKAIRDLAAPWQKNAALAYLGYDDNGVMQYLDMSAFDPYSYLKKPLYAAIRGIGTTEERIADAVWEAAAPFFGIDITTQHMIEVLMNKRIDDGGQIYNPEDTFTGKANPIAKYLKGLLPGFTTNVEGIGNAARDMIYPENNIGRHRKMSDELYALAGFRTTSLNIPQSLTYSAYEFTDSLKNANMILSRQASRAGRVSEDDLRSAYDRTLEARGRVYGKIIDQVQAARRLGVQDSEIWTALLAARVSKKDAITIIVHGRVPPYQMSREFIESAEDRVLLSAPEKDRKPIITKEFERRRDVIRKIINEPTGDR